MPRALSERNILYDNTNTKNYKRVQFGDFIIHLRSFEGGLEMANEQGIVSPAYTILRHIKPIAFGFYKAYFRTNEFINHILSKSVEGIRDGKQISYEAFKWLSIPYCQLKEQQKIADFLSLVDQRIEKQRQLVEALKKYKRGLLSIYFTRFSDLKLIRLGEFAKIYQPATISQHEFTDGKYRVFGANGYIGYYDNYNHSTEQVTISCRGEKCGTVNFVGAYSWITGNSMVVNIDEQNIVDKRYLYHCLSNQNLKYLISGSAQPQIIRGDVARHTIPVPPLQQQKSLSQFLDLIENLADQTTDILERMQTLKKGLLQQMFI